VAPFVLLTITCGAELDGRDIPPSRELQAHQLRGPTINAQSVALSDDNATVRDQLSAILNASPAIQVRTNTPKSSGWSVTL